MTKRELVKEAIKWLRLNIEIAQSYRNEENWKMYSHVYHSITSRVDFLYELGILNYQQYSRLSDIVTK